jgi:hypothetical protein
VNPHMLVPEIKLDSLEMLQYVHWYCAYIRFVGNELSQAHFHKNKCTTTNAPIQAHFHKNKQGYSHTFPCAAAGRERRTPVANVLVLLGDTGRDYRTPALCHKSGMECRKPDLAQ